MMMNRVRKRKSFVGRTTKKTQELRDRLTPENIGNQEKIESDITKAKIRKKDIQQEF